MFEEITLEDTGTKQVMWPTHCVQESHGSKFHEDLDISDSDVIVKKGQNDRVDSYSGFGTPPEDTGLNQMLKDAGVGTCYVVGLAYDYCVGQTARDAAKNGYKSYILMDGTKAISEDSTKAMDQELETHGVQKIQSSELPA